MFISKSTKGHGLQFVILVDFDPFLFQDTWLVIVLFRAVIDLSAVVLIFLTKCFPWPNL